jgi:divalent metal cation (Fe/Co/Zn/Cd) transporter
MAMAAAASAAHHPRVWWLDPAGALVIATYIIISWFFILRQQVNIV